ncbi:MAG: helix-turn-helix domain-containing protein [Balneolaceae bacterium]|jgi:transcriptional regulator with XRE-family HTH domain
MASLGNDLASIRKEKNLTIDDIHEATKIPKNLIEAIENGSIFSDYEENKTYIRSYVRSYAKVLSIDERDIIFALNKQDKGAYAGSLRKESIESEKEIFNSDNQDSEETTESDEPDSDEEVKAHSPVSSHIDSNTFSKPKETTGPSQKPPEVGSVDWADMGRRFQPLKTTQSKVWMGAIVMLLIAAAGTFFYFYDAGSPTPISSQAQKDAASSNASSDSIQLQLVPPAAEDSTQLAENAQSTGNNQISDTLPDTLSLVVYAAYGKLEPVRVYTDIMDNINPYWIEQGSALRFNFVNEVRIRGQFSRMVLLMNGHLVQNFREQFYNPDTRLLEIHRSFFEGDPKWLQTPPDSLGIAAPPPTIIKQRPTFN